MPPGTAGMERLGTILRVWPRAGAAQVELEAGRLRVGDRIRIRGPGRDFVQEVVSLEVDQVARGEGGPGDFVAIAVMQPVRAKDEVYRLGGPG